MAGLMNVAADPSRAGTTAVRTLVLGALLLSATPAVAATFDLRLYRYCSPGTFCGHASLQAYDRYICQSVEELNLIWQPTGFSFRPTILPVDSTSPSDPTGLPPGKTKYYQVNGCEDGQNDQLARQHWSDNVAKPAPAVLSLMLTKGPNTCCSGIPRTFKKLENQYGFYCDANPDRTVRGSGSIWAHEMGHHWSLSHTHGGCADVADGQDPTGDADAGVAKGCNADNPAGDRPGCDTDIDCAPFGMCVPDALPAVADTPADRCRFEACTERCQGDPDANKQYCSTDADCAAGEGPCACPGADEDDEGNILGDHTWFASPGDERSIIPAATSISTGSPHGSWCPVQIKTRSGGFTSGSDTAPPSEVTVRDVMSYHSAFCRGPYVVAGDLREAFTADQLSRIAACRTQIFPRDAAHLPDVCATRGGDSDHDGICDLDDNCPDVRNTCQTDSDSDGAGDACDCPGAPQPSSDLDADGIPDACDSDRDGDGCYNDTSEDDHPDDAQLPGTTTIFVGCGVDSETEFVSDAADTDGDGDPNCRDSDDDGDGLCDAPGPGCTQVGDPCPEVPGESCTVFASGEPCAPPWAVCGLDCVALFLKIVAVINPDPTLDLVFDRFSIVNRTIFAAPPRGKTAAESAQAIADKAAGSGLVASAGQGLSAAVPGSGQVRLDIWQRLPDGTERRVATVGEFDAAHVSLGELVRGGLIRLVPTMDVTGAPMLEVETSYGIGTRASEATDRDGDGHPDLLDNCLKTPNPEQQDGNGDGFGDSCDADLDQDGVVDADDVARVRACDGADLTVEMPVLEPARFDGEDLGQPLPAPEALAAALAAACRDADLDGNGLVDASDRALADGLLGQTPGPSALARGIPILPPSLTPVCVAGATLAPAKLLLARLDRPPGSQRLKLKGKLELPLPLTPAARGLLLTLRDATGEAVLEARIPAGAGWKTRKSSARYVNRGGLAGINRVVVRWDEQAGVTVRVAGRRADISLGAPALPLLWQLGLDPSVAATRQCGETAFGAPPERPSCVLKKGGAVVSCR